MSEGNIFEWFKEAWKNKCGKDYDGFIPFTYSDNFSGKAVMDLCLFVEKKARQEGLIDAINVVQKKADYFNKRISQGIAYNFDEMKIKWTAHYNLCLQLVNKLKELKSKND